MDQSTPPPLPETMEYGQLTVETIDDVAPRLKRFTKDLIARLEACKIQIKTTTVYLLNSTDHPIEVPCSGNDVSIEMNFDAILPIWSPEPRARLQVSFNYGRRYFYSERGKNNKKKEAYFPMAKIMGRFLHEIQTESQRRRIQSEAAIKADQARQSFISLRADLGIPPSENPDIIRKDNLKIMCLPQTPTQVVIMLTVPHVQAFEIAKKYLKNNPF